MILDEDEYGVVVVVVVVEDSVVVVAVVVVVEDDGSLLENQTLTVKSFEPETIYSFEGIITNDWI